MTPSHSRRWLDFSVLHRIRGFTVTSEFGVLSNSLRSSLYVIDVIAHCHQQCVLASLANRASHISVTVFFRMVMTPSLTPVRPGLQRLLDGLL